MDVCMGGRAKSRRWMSVWDVGLKVDDGCLCVR